MNNKKTILITALIILVISLITTVSVVVYNKNQESATTLSIKKETKMTTSTTESTTQATTASTTATTSTTKAATTKKRVTTTTTTTTKQTISPDQEFRAVWISYLDLQMKSEKGGTASSFTTKVDTMFGNVKNMGLNTVIVQVRPFSDAYYDSGIFPWSYYISGQQGKALNYDPLKILVQEAHKYGLQIHAWVNLYRVAFSTSPFFNSLSSDNPASIHTDWLMNVLDSNGNVSSVMYNPAITDVQKTIIDGVREIVQNYEVDGIHIDDYFYPTSGSYEDGAQYNAYVASGGQKGVADWRRDNVDALISGIYSGIKAINGNVKFGISPFAGVNKCYNSYFANVQEWSQNPGYCDYIVPQVYFGFQNQTMPYETVATQWSNLVTCSSVKLYYGLAFHKCGMANDSNAGTGRYEWANNSDIICRQVQYARNLNRYGGFALFSYHCIYQESNKIAVTEYQNLKSIL